MKAGEFWKVFAVTVAPNMGSPLCSGGSSPMTAKGLSLSFVGLQ